MINKRQTTTPFTSGIISPQVTFVLPRSFCTNKHYALAINLVLNTFFTTSLSPSWYE